MKPFGHRGHLLGLLPVLLLGGILRFYHLADRGVFLSDEGYYLNGAKTVRAAFDYGRRKYIVHEPLLPSFQEYLVEQGGGYPDTAKPGYYLLLTLSFLMFGAKDYAALFVSALLGTLTLLIVFLIGKKAFHERVGLWAAFLLALSPYHINYSRSALTTSTSIFFTFVAIYLYLLWHERNMLHRESFRLLGASGFFFGYAFTCHYNLFWLLLFCIGLHTYLCFLHRPGEDHLFTSMKRWTGFILCMAVPVLIFDLPYRTARQMLVGAKSISTGLPYDILTYSGQIKSQFFSVGGAAFSLDDPFFYVKLFLRTEGIVVVSLAGMGLTYILSKAVHRRLTISDLFILAMIFLPFFLFSFHHYRVARAVALMVPAMSLAASFGIEWLFRFLEKPRYVKNVFSSVLVVFLLSTEVARAAPIINARSHYEEAFNFIATLAPNHKCISSNPPAASFYLGNKYAYPLWHPTRKEARRLFEEENYQYLCLVVGKVYYDTEATSFIEEMERTNSKYPSVFEINSSSFELLDKENPSPPKRISQDQMIRVYDLKKIFKEIQMVRP